MLSAGGGCADWRCQSADGCIHTRCMTTLFRSFVPLDAVYCGKPVAGKRYGNPACREHALEIDGDAPVSEEPPV